MAPKNYAQVYRTEWEQMADFKHWVQPAPNDDTMTRAYCKYCKCDMKAKYSVLKSHIISKKHLKSTAPLKSQRKITCIKKDVNLETKKSEAALALFICEHASILTVNHLSELCKKRFSDSKSADLRLHRTKCTNIIKNILGPHFQEELVKDIGDKEYSLLIDESTDISVTKLLGVSVRYFSTSLKKIVSTFLGLVALQDGTAESIVDGVKYLITSVKMDLKKLIGVGTDNAYVMTGVNNGVHQKLINETQKPNLILVRCVCHSLQLAVSHASEETLPRNIEFLIRETYNWFSHSSNRQIYYKDLYKTINCGSEPLKIPQLCNTRWISIEPAVKQILAQWAELKLLSDMARRKENCYMAEMLFKMYSDPANHLYLLYIKPILEEVQVVKKLFESNYVDVTKLYKDLVNLTTSIDHRITNPTAIVNVLTDNVSSYVDPSLYMGYAFETTINESNLQAHEILTLRQRCLDFTLKLVSELQARLPANYKLLEKISMFSVQETLKVLKPDIHTVAQELEKENTDIDKLISQWRNIVHIKWECTTSTTEFWSEVINYMDSAGNNPFKELGMFACKILSLPHSNAEIERVFSQVNIVKTKLRNRLHVSTLNAILYCRFGLRRLAKCCHSYDFPNKVLQMIGTNATYTCSTSTSSPSTSNTSSTPVPSTSSSSSGLVIVTSTSAPPMEDFEEDIDILFTYQNQD